MTVFELQATLGLDSSEYSAGLGAAKGEASSFASSFKKIIGGIAIGAAVKKSVDAVVGLTKSAVTAYADYQQLEGGVQTLFGNGGKSFEQYAESASKSLYKMGQRGEDVLKLQKELIAAGYDVGEAGADGIYGPKTQAAFDAYAKAGGQMVRDVFENAEKAQQKVLDNADNAFMTAGLSANEYMETVTSFSASLLQSMGGDTDKAADKADMAIRDMSDNANKMGTDMSMIQTAYAGFAKQNYTMLDNLKLGYGGTKTEMERLLKDAEAISGVKYDISSYADIIDAIHVVQDEMGITGTTTEEAKDTIEGSIKSTKAAWTNLLTALGSGKDVKKAIGNLTMSAKNVVKNIMPVIKNALEGIGTLLTELAPVISEELPVLMEELLPPLLGAIGQLVAGVIQNLPGILAALGKGLADGFSVIWDSLVNQFPIVGEIAEKIGSFFKSAWNGVKTVWENATAFFKTIWEEIKGNETLVALGDDISSIFTKAWDAIKAVWNAVSDFFSTLWGFIKGDVTLNEVGESFKNVFITAWDSIKAIWDTVVGFFSDLWTSIKDDPVLGTIASALETVYTTAWDAIKAVWDAVTGYFSTLWGLITGDATLEEVGKSLTNVFTTAWDAIKAVWNAVTDYYASIWNNIIKDSSLGELLSAISKPFIDAYDSITSAWSGAVDWATSTFNSIRDVVTSAFQSIVDKVTSAINAIREFLGLQQKYDTSVVGEYGPQPSRQKGLGSLPHYNASAMDTGHIYNKPTLFGYADGRYQIAGDVGAEAVVGVNSLDKMIKNSVAAAVANIRSVQQPTTVQLVLDSGVLIGEVDLGLNEVAAWRGGGRA